MVGSAVDEAYQVLLRATVVINLIPFVYVFLALATLDRVSALARSAGGVGAAITTAGILAAFLPDDNVTSVAIFELKMVAGVVGPLLIGIWLFARSQRRAVKVMPR
jgi:hypothetical protein